MPNNTWHGSHGGNFADANDWSLHHVPTATETAVIGNVLAAVTSAANETVLGLDLSSTKSLLEVTGDDFNVDKVTNAGRLLATGGTLTIGGAASTVTNTGTIGADGGAVVFDNETVLQTNSSTNTHWGFFHHRTIVTPGAVISATGSDVTLLTTQIEAGTLTSSGGGVIQTGDSGSVLNGSTTRGSIANTGVLLVASGDALGVKGVINNLGTIQDDGDLTVSGAVTLAGSGGVVMSSAGVISGYTGSTLTNDNTITGGGAIYGSMGVTNNGVINDTTGAMLINNQNGSGVTNNGLIESTGTGNLGLKDVTVGGSGSIDAFAAVKLDSATINGGSVTVESGGVLTVASTISNIGTGVDVSNAGTIKITSGAYLYTSSNISGAGSITIAGAGTSNADLKAVGDVTLSGGGQVSMNVNGFITGYTGSSLTNADTITGGGAIFGSMAVTNDGVINDDFGPMLINNQNGGGWTNNGLMESTVSGELNLKDVTLSGSGTIDDQHQVKLVVADIQSGTITVESAALFEVVSGSSSLGAAVSITNDKSLEVSTGGALTIDGAITNNGLMQTLANGVLTVDGNVTGTGSVRITGSGNFTLDGAMSENVALGTGATGNLVLGSSSDFTGTIAGLSPSGANAVDLKGVAYNSTDKAVFSGTTAGGTLTVETSSDEVLATLNLVGNYTKSTFKLSNDGSGDTLVKDPTPSHQLSQAIASFGASSGSGATHATAATLTTEHLITMPRV